MLRESKPNLSHLSQDLENLLATTQAQVNPHSLLQIFQTANIFQRILQAGIRRAGKTRSILPIISLPGRSSLPLRVPPCCVHPHPNSRKTIPLPLRRDLTIPIPATGGQITPASTWVLEQEIEPNGDRLGQGLQRPLFLNQRLPGGLRLLSL